MRRGEKEGVERRGWRGGDGEEEGKGEKSKVANLFSACPTP